MEKERIKNYKEETYIEIILAIFFGIFIGISSTHNLSPKSELFLIVVFVVFSFILGHLLFKFIKNKK